MKIVAIALAAASLGSASPASASPPPARPSVHYYLIDGRTRVAGPFSSFFACDTRRVNLEKLHGDALFCASDWIAR